MQKNLLINKTVTSILLIGVFCLSIPQESYAANPELRQSQQNTAQTNTSAPTQTTGSNTNTSQQAQENAFRQNVLRQSNIGTNDAQAGAYDGDTSGSAGATGSASGAVSDALGCSASSLLGQAVATGLKSLATKAIGTVTSALTTVPISANAVGDNIDKGATAADADASTNAFQQIFGVPFGASFNGIAFCIVNGLITYIADSTIAWANSGFQGNPVFLENTGNFLQGLADRQASEFIGALAYNTTGLNVCEPFRVDLAIALSESYGGQDQAGVNPAAISCSMDQIGQNFESFANGGGIGGASIDGYWSNWNQMRQTENNPWGAYIEAGEYLRAQVDVKQNTATFELGLNNGYLNFEKCEDPAAAKKGDKKSCKTYTPGSLIESSLNDTIKLGKERLVAAEKIDQVITAVANALIKKALNKVLEKN